MPWAIGSTIGGSVSEDETLPVALHRPLDLAATLDGGQAFRWIATEGGWWEGPVGGTIVRVRASKRFPRVLDVHQAGDVLSEPELRSYFGLDDRLDAAHAALEQCGVPPDLLSRSVGLHLLRQDPWETLVGFILSQNSNIPRIKDNLEYLTGHAGSPIPGGSRAWRMIPTPAAIIDLGEDQLRQGRLGYRAAHLVATARLVHDGAVDLDGLLRGPFDSTRRALLGLPGVGPKVADCVLAYALGFGEAFPVDTWVHKAVGRWWPDVASTNRERIASWGREVFGQNAAHAQLVLFGLERGFRRRND